MVGRLWVLFLLILSLSLVGCVVAPPDVSSITDLPSFSNKSESPFLQENVGGAIFFSGQCLPGVTGFEFRMNEQPAWQAIPSAAPTPNLAQGEYLVGTPAYDLDCSDGTFDFYLFQTEAMNYFTNNGYAVTPADPESIELRTAGIAGLPTLIFRRPVPSTFEVQRENFSYNNYLENSRAYPFRVRLKGADNSYAVFGTGESKQINIALTDMDAPALLAGEIYSSTCMTPATAADLTFNQYVEEISLCYVAVGTTDHHLIQADISAIGMISTSFYLPIKPTNSVLTYLNSSGPGSALPTTLLKGVEYTFQSGIMPLYNANPSRFVQAFSGTLAVSSSATTVEFKQVTGDSNCPTAWTPALINCAMSSPMKAFNLKIDPAHGTDTATINVATFAFPGCSSGCQIQESGTNYPISTYQASQTQFKVASGPNVYNQPHFSTRDPIMRVNDCSSAEIALANVDGTVIPGVSMSMTVAVNSLDAVIYSDGVCGSTFTTSSLVVPFNSGDVVKRIAYKVLRVPPGGQITWSINDGTTSFFKYFYAKFN